MRKQSRKIIQLFFAVYFALSLNWLVEARLAETGKIESTEMAAACASSSKGVWTQEVDISQKAEIVRFGQGWGVDEEGLIRFDDGRVIYMTLDDIRSHIGTWFSDEEIRWITLITMAEDMIAYSDTIWAAHVWCILNRLDSGSFPNTIGTILAQKGQFDTYLPENLANTPSPEVEEIVRDVLARYIYEKIGAPEELVGRVLPATHCFFKGGDEKYNHFYSYCWGDEYNPFDSPHNPYDN